MEEAGKDQEEAEVVQVTAKPSEMVRTVRPEKLVQGEQGKDFSARIAARLKPHVNISALTHIPLQEKLREVKMKVATEYALPLQYLAPNVTKVDSSNAEYKRSVLESKRNLFMPGDTQDKSSRNQIEGKDIWKLELETTEPPRDETIAEHILPEYKRYEKWNLSYTPQEEFFDEKSKKLSIFVDKLKEEVKQEVIKEVEEEVDEKENNKGTKLRDEMLQLFHTYAGWWFDFSEKTEDIRRECNEKAQKEVIEKTKVLDVAFSTIVEEVKTVTKHERLPDAELEESRPSSEPEIGEDPYIKDRTRNWLLNAIVSVKSLLRSKTPEQDTIDENACYDALKKLTKGITGFLKVTLHLDVSESDEWLTRLFTEFKEIHVNESKEEFHEIIDHPDEFVVDDLFQPSKHTKYAQHLHQVVKDDSDYFTVTVNFVLENGQSFNRTYRFFCPIEDIRVQIADICKVPNTQVQFEYKGNILDINDTLAGIGAYPSESIDFKLTSKDPLRYPLRTKDVITVSLSMHYQMVTVQIDSLDSKEVHLDVEHHYAEKKYDGGYLNKLTGTEYHHGFTQTGPRPKRKVKRFHRDTQTEVTRNRNDNTTVEMSTQMFRRDLYIPSNFQRIITPKPYITAEEIERIRNVEGKVRTIQHYWKAYKLRQMVKYYSREYRKYLEWVKNELAERAAASERRCKLDIVHKAFPRTREDFEILYGMLEQWRSEQVEKIKQLRLTPGIKAFLMLVFEDQHVLLKSIEEHRLLLAEEKRAKDEIKLMNTCSEPITWTDEKGRTVTMDSLRTQRARDLKEIFHALCQNDVTLEERIELLVSIKYALAPYSKILLCQELLLLLERESELLLMGLKNDQIDYLRLRIQKLYLEMMKLPEFNPEAAKYSMEYNIKDLEYTMFYCKGCSKLLSMDMFDVTTDMIEIKRCRSCVWLDDMARKRVDYTPYRHMLRAVRRNEAKKRCNSSIAFIMKERDIYYLVYYIWHSKSFLSKDGDINDLRLPRWRVNEEWSPWNTILLKESEVIDHLHYEKPEDVYCPDFIEDVRVRHVQARVHFSSMYLADKKLTRCRIFAEIRGKKYVAPPPEADIF